MHLAALAVVLLSATPAAAKGPGASLALAPCTLSHPLVAARVAARCGTLDVPEDRARPGGRRISLAIAVVPAEAARPEPDPVFVLAGGPGQAIREVFPVLAPAFARLAASRDLVLVDQRGSGGSGRLRCPGLEAPERVLDDPARELRAVAECARTLGAGLAHYRTDDFVADLEAVRAVLGRERVNVVGFSYGTRAALAWLRAHPERVRTLVLDGVVPFQLPVGSAFDEDGRRALELLAARCAAAPACAARVGALGPLVDALGERLARRPERVRTRHPLTGERLEATFGPEALRAVITSFLYQAETAAVLPVMLRAAADGDLGPLAAQGVGATADLEAGLSRPLQLSVLCAEDVPFHGTAPAPAPGARLPGRSARGAFEEVCRLWPVPPVPPAWRAPLRSPAPALLLSGDADPVTPPRWAELLGPDLPAARHVVVPGQGHGVFARGCVPRLVADFVEAGSAAALDSSCATSLPVPPVFVDLLGASP